MRVLLISLSLLVLTSCSKNETYYSCDGVMEKGVIQSKVPYITEVTNKKNVNITVTVKGNDVYLGGDNSYLEILSRGYIWKSENEGEIFFTSTPYEDINKQYERLHKVHPDEKSFREELNWEQNHTSGGKLNLINKTLTLYRDDNTCYKPERMLGTCGLYNKGNFVCKQVTLK